MSQYEVVSPIGRRAPQRKSGGARPRSLDGVTIAELSNHKFDSAFTFEVIEEALRERYPNVKFVSHREFGDVYGARENEVLGALSEKFKAFEVDLVISGNAG